MANVRCLSGRMEIQIAILPLQKEYKRVNPEISSDAARTLAYEAFYSEMQRQTAEMKRAIWKGRPTWNL